MNMSEIGIVGFFGFGASLAISLGLVLTTRWHGRFSLDGTTGVQKFHAIPTPRIGGIAIFSGLLCACLVAAEATKALLAPILIAGLPAFFFGIAEDMTKRVSVRTRLLATMGSGVAAWYLTGFSVTHTGLGGVDAALTILPFSVMFTAFAVSGVANAVNIIDGFNGLASGTVLISLVAMGLIASSAGDTELASVCFIVAAVTVGFLLVNFPFGKLFLGDGGAYLLGFVMAWLAVMLAARNPSVSVWAPFLACGYPVFETLVTIVRRTWTKHAPGQPDSNHLHSLIKVTICLRYFRRLNATLRNAAVSPFSWAIAAVPATLAVQFATDEGVLVLSSVGCLGLYAGLYLLLASVPRMVHDQTATVPGLNRAVVTSEAGQTVLDGDVQRAA